MKKQLNFDKEFLSLSKYLPDGAVNFIIPLIESYHLKIKISKPRRTKYGYYKPPTKINYHHQISINANLNKYSFLITFLHELAHLKTWEQYKNTVKPHGEQWKFFFKELLISFIIKKIFPTDLSIALSRHIKSIKSSTSTDLKLTAALKKYDEKKELTVNDIPLYSIFKVSNGKVFKKGEKRRTRYKCLCLNNNKEYLIHPFCPIKPVD